jgi:hypothetical protein
VRFMIRCGAVLFLLAPSLGAQSDSTLRIRVGSILSKAGDRPLPRGDTLVEFAKQGPILYFTVRGTADSIASCMVRNDGLVGWAGSQWTAERLTGFTTRWASPQGVQLEIRGQVVGAQVKLSGAKSDHLIVPSIPWAVADYGMDDQLVPVLLRLRGDSAQVIAVWRPFGQKWDTLTVRRRLIDGVSLITTGATTWAISADRRLLFAEDRDQSSDRRPLEGNARFAEYQRIVAIVRRP